MPKLKKNRAEWKRSRAENTSASPAQTHHKYLVPTFKKGKFKIPTRLTMALSLKCKKKTTEELIPRTSRPSAGN